MFRLIFWALLCTAALAVCLATLAGFLSRLWWVFDLFSHFRVQYFAALLLSTILFLLGGRLWWAAVSASFALLNLVLFLPLYIPPRPAKVDALGVRASQRTYRLLMMNVLKINRSYGRVRDLIRKERPDITVLVEANQTWMDELAEVLVELPYQETSLREDNYGVALLSRYPFTWQEVRAFCEARVPSVIACLELEDRSLTLVATHPPPPKSAQETRHRNQQLSQLGVFLADQSGEKMVAGDLNITTWAPVFQDLLRKAGLRESRLGFGVQASWPTDRPTLKIPIDHALVSPGILVHRRAVGPDVGSDHYPVILEFSFRDGVPK